MSTQKEKHKIKIFFPMPIYGGVDPYFFQSVLKFLNAPKYEIHPFFMIGDSHVGRSRNRCASAFLASNCDYLLFIDSDIIFDGAHVDALVERDLDIVGGLYPKKQKELAWVCNALQGNDTCDDTGLQEMRYMGTGFLLIKRRVFERLKNEIPELAYHPDDGEQAAAPMLHDFFRSGVYAFGDRRRWLSEDWYFCQMARDVGFKVYADCRVALKHVGQLIYPLTDPFAAATAIPEWLDKEAAEYDMELDGPPKTVLDIGANVGAFAKRARAKWPESSIICFEPIPTNFMALKVNVPPADKTQHFQRAVRSFNGKTLIRRDLPFNGHTCEGATPVNGLEVEALDAREIPSAEFVKMDVEGLETEILPRLNLSATKAIAVEFHGPDRERTIKDYLLVQGFELVGSGPVVDACGVLKFKRKEAA